MATPAIAPPSSAKVEPVVYQLDHAGSRAQLAFWSSEHRFRLFLGGVGAGKTRAGAVECLRMPSGSPGMVVAPTYKIMRQSTLPGLFEIVRPLLIPGRTNDTLLEKVGKIDLAAEFNKSDLTLRLVNGTQIYLRSGEDPESLRGPSLGWAWLDEAALMDRMVMMVMVGRLRVAPERLWLTTTPKGKDWLYEFFVTNASPDRTMIRCSTRSNPFTSESYKRSLEGAYDEHFAKQELGAEFIEWVDAPCYSDFKRDIHVTKCRDWYTPLLPLVVTCDMNVRYMAWPICQVIGGRPVVIDEVTMPHNAQDSEMVKLVRDKYPAHPGEVWIYGDASGRARKSQTAQSDYDLIQLAFRDYPSPVVLRALHTNPAPKDRIGAVNRLLRGQAGVPKLVVDEGCVELIDDLLQTGWNKHGTAEDQFYNPDDPRYKRSHASSALGYWLYREWPVSKELYSTSTKPRKQPDYSRVTLPGDL